MDESDGGFSYACTLVNFCGSSLMQLKMTPRLWAFTGLLVWGATILYFEVIRLDAYGVDENAARAILLVWSVVDRVINPIFIMGMPDLRALLFVPAGIYWPGSILAVKILTLLVTYGGVLFVYHWSKHHQDGENALLAAGLLLIAPVTVFQIDTIGAGPYLLLLFGTGAWLDQVYRKAQRPLGGWFFLQMLLIIIAISIHPMALAYPLALVFEWYLHPVDKRQQRHIYLGLGSAVIFSLLLRSGWHEQSWLHNPFATLAGILFGPAPESSPHWAWGILAGVILVALFVRHRRQIRDSLLPRMLAIAIVIGLLTADQAWNLLVLACLLIFGIQSLIDVNRRLGGQSFAGQRGLVMLMVFVFATLFMQGDKAHQAANGYNQLAPHDKLIQTLAALLEDSKEDTILIMSQWPGKTMLATHRPVIPLPPDYKNADTLLKNIGRISHIIFDPRSPANRTLSKQLSTLASQTETLALESGGVVISLRHDQNSVAGPAPTDP